MEQERRLRELEGLRDRVSVLEAQIDASSPQPTNWPPRQFYWLYYAIAGFALGGIGAMTSLLFNVVVSFFEGRHPFHIIQVYLTVGLGATALTLNDNLTLVMGCLLYLLFGMLLGIPFHSIISRRLSSSSMLLKFAAVTVASLTVWIGVFYGILSWLQPMLTGGNWVLHEIPWWLAASTHLVYGWTMLAVQQLGRFAPFLQSATMPDKAPVLALHRR
jgi:hypothetical protein